MARLRIRTQLLIATVLIIFALTGALLLIIQHAIGVEVKNEVREGTKVSAQAFETEQRQRELQSSRAASMLAELPTLEALMTTNDALTIQDGSVQYAKLAGSDLLVLAEPDRRVVALHVSKPGWSAESAQRALERSLNVGEDASWWYESGRLYWVFSQPVLAGSGSSARLLGTLAIGYEVDSVLAKQLAAVAGNQIALETAGTVIASTLPSEDTAALQQRIKSGVSATESDSALIQLGTNQYAFATVLLHGDAPSPVRCYVLMSMAPANEFLQRLNRTIFLLGLGAIMCGALIFGFVAQTITSPLDSLVAGVQALSAGNFTYSIVPRGSSEVADLSTAFAEMRSQLLASQQQKIETERVAALGRAASSISHDLRHYLAALVANAEFLFEADELMMNKAEIYGEIKTAANQMTDLIDSLRELSSQRVGIIPEPSDIHAVLRRAIEAVRARPEFRTVNISVEAPDDLEGVFDPRKMERVFFNLILNACEASGDGPRMVVVDAGAVDEEFEVRVRDNASGVASAVRDSLFTPFVSFGKPNGTGVGLAIVAKIVQDHGGTVEVEQTSEAGTVLLVRIPRVTQASQQSVNSSVIPS
jgi:signal transduction histidine kinase